MKIIGYLRVSTTGQVKDGLGLPTQERLLRAWVRRDGHRLVRIVSDNGKSGTLDETARPGLLEALRAVESREVDAVAVTSLDRLARTLTVQEAVLGQVWRLGGKVLTVDSGEVPTDDPDDPMRTAMRQMAGVFAQLERNLVIKRLRNGRATKRAQGGYTGQRLPYGFRLENGEVVPDEVEQQVVALVGRMRAAGASLREIVAALDSAGLSPRGERWHPTTIARIAAQSPVPAGRP